MKSAAKVAGGAASRSHAYVDDRSGLFDDGFLRTLEHLHLVSRRVFSGNIRAERRTRKVGSGIEFADHRTYTRGDDFRYIDWNLYGRLDKLLLRLFEEEEDLHIYFLVDVSNSMAFGAPMPKLHFAMQVTAALSYVGLANLDRIAIVPFSNRLGDHLPRTRGKNRIHRVFEFLRSCTIGGITDVAECMKSFVAQHKRRGLAVVISDFYDPKGFEQGINTLRYYKHEPFVLQVYDQREAKPLMRTEPGKLSVAGRPGMSLTWGDLTVVDCETGESRDVTLSKSLLEAYEREYQQYCKNLETYCTKYAVPFFRTHTAIPFDELVLTIFRSGGFLR